MLDAAIQSGFPFTVSVPDGAPPARDEQGNLVAVPEGADDVAPEHDEKYRYIFNNWPRLEKVKRFILATDGDEPGWRLAQELARRLGRARCAFVTYPQAARISTKRWRNTASAASRPASLAPSPSR